MPYKVPEPEEVEFIELIEPQVPITLPGEEEASWVYLHDELTRNRVLFLCEELDPEISNDLMALIMYLGMEDQNILFFINSPGGDIINGMTIHNLMQYVPAEIITICLGQAASIASYILAGGQPKKRKALPHARIMIHQPICKLGFSDDDNEDEKTEVGELYNELESMLAIRETITRGYSEKTGKPFWIIAQDMEREFYMSATEAKAYGIIDEIKGKSKEENT